MRTQEHKQILRDSGHFFDALLGESSVLGARSRFHFFAQAFMDKPYCLGALGEGAESDFDQYPRYRSDAVDCVTFINTLLALLVSGSLDAFKQYMIGLSYTGKEVSYTNRFHFTASQWNVALSGSGMLKDITSDLSLLLPANAMRHSHIHVDQRAWYANKTTDDVRLLGDATERDKQCRLDRLLVSTQHLDPLESQIGFISFEALFDLSLDKRHGFYAAIPSGTIFEVVRKQWDIQSTIGTPLEVCHMGLVREVDGEVFCQHASSSHGRVIMESCDACFQSWFSLDSLSGVNFQKIMINGLS